MTRRTLFAAVGAAIAGPKAVPAIAKPMKACSPALDMIDSYVMKHLVPLQTDYIFGIKSPLIYNLTIPGKDEDLNLRIVDGIVTEAACSDERS